MKTIELINHDEPAIVDDEDYDVLSQFMWEAAWGENDEVVGALRWIDDPKNSRIQYGVFMHDEIMARAGELTGSIDVMLRRVAISVDWETLSHDVFMSLIGASN